MKIFTDLFQDNGKWSLGRVMATVQFAFIIRHFLNVEALSDNQILLFGINMSYIQMSKYFAGKAENT